MPCRARPHDFVSADKAKESVVNASKCAALKQDIEQQAKSLDSGKERLPCLPSPPTGIQFEEPVRTKSANQGAKSFSEFSCNVT